MCKFTVVSLQSSMFYSVVDAGMKSAAGFGSYLFFNEHADWSDGVGFGLVLLSSVPMLYGDKLESQKRAGLEQSILEQPEEAEGDSAAGTVKSRKRIAAPSSCEVFSQTDH